MNKIEYSIIGLTILLMFYLVTHAQITVHEKIHQQIYQNYGVDSKTINHLSFSDFNIKEIYKGRLGYTIPIGDFSNCDLECNNLHIMNEIEGYHSSNLMFTMFICLFIILIIFHSVTD